MPLCIYKCNVKGKQELYCQQPCRYYFQAGNEDICTIQQLLWTILVSISKRGYVYLIVLQYYTDSLVAQQGEIDFNSLEFRRQRSDLIETYQILRGTDKRGPERLPEQNINHLEWEEVVDLCRSLIRRLWMLTIWVYSKLRVKGFGHQSQRIWNEITSLPSKL